MWRGIVHIRTLFKYVPFNSCSIFNLIMSSGSGNIYFRSEFWWFKHSSQCVSCPTSLTLQVIQTRLSPPQTPVPHWSPPRRRTTWSRPTRYIQYSIFPVSNSLIYQAMEDGYSGDPLDMRALKSCFTAAIAPPRPREDGFKCHDCHPQLQVWTPLTLVIKFLFEVGGFIFNPSHGQII